MNYIRKNNKVIYVGVEPKNIDELNKSMVGLFIELGFKQEESGKGINFFFKRDLCICTYIKDDHFFSISSPTKNQIMTALKFYNTTSFSIEIIIDVMTQHKNKFDMNRNLNISSCNLVISFIRLLWYSGDKDYDDYLKDIKEFIENMS